MTWESSSTYNMTVNNDHKIGIKKVDNGFIMSINNYIFVFESYLNMNYQLELALKDIDRFLKHYETFKRLPPIIKRKDKK